MICVQEANEKYLKKWDELITTSINGTIFNRLDFLKYHKNRFTDKERHLIIHKDGNVFAQISLTLEHTDNEIIGRSPYGGSYGGLILQSYPSYHTGREIVSALMSYLNAENVDRFIITPPISCCSEYPLDSFYFNLFESGFRSINRDISSVFCFNDNKPIDNQVLKRSMRMAKKAETNGVKIIENGSLPDFWEIMEDTLKKHGGNPTHTFEEFKYLNSLFPKKIYPDIAYLNDNPIAAIGVFTINHNMKCSFYICQKQEYQKYQGLSLLIINALAKCKNDGFKFFDFGTTSINMIARKNIFQFKNSFSNIGFFRETFEWRRNP